MCLPRRNVLVTSSFTGWNIYMMDLGKLMGDPEAMTHFGNTVVIWDLHTRQPKKILDVPGAPLEIRCASPVMRFKPPAVRCTRALRSYFC
jgi:selenium-binding protein 1